MYISNRAYLSTTQHRRRKTIALLLLSQRMVYFFKRNNIWERMMSLESRFTLGVVTSCQFMSVYSYTSSFLVFFSFFFFACLFSLFCPPPPPTPDPHPSKTREGNWSLTRRCLFQRRSGFVCPKWRTQIFLFYFFRRAGSVCHCFYDAFHHTKKSPLSRTIIWSCVVSHGECLICILNTLFQPPSWLIEVQCSKKSL